MATSILLRMLLLLQLPLLRLALATQISLPPSPTAPTTLRVAPPTTTPAPDVLELKKRQAGQVCGYIEANPTEPVWCNAGYQCAINTHNGAAGCCVNPQTCYYHTSCVPYASMAGCGEACLQDSFVTKCNNPASQYCYEYYITYAQYDGWFTEVGCSPYPGVATVYDGYTTLAGGPVVPTVVNLIEAEPSPTPAAGTCNGNCGTGSSGNGNGNSGNGNGNGNSGNGNTINGSSNILVFGQGSVSVPNSSPTAQPAGGEAAGQERRAGGALAVAVAAAAWVVV